MEMKLKMPGGEIANRPLHFFWVVDCSGSMSGSKIDAVNHAIQECIQPMKDEVANYPNAQLYIRTLKFSTGASWVTADPVRIEDFAWEDLETDGITDMGKAFEMIAAQLEMPPCLPVLCPRSSCCCPMVCPRMTGNGLWKSC